MVKEEGGVAGTVPWGSTSDHPVKMYWCQKSAQPISTIWHLNKGREEQTGEVFYTVVHQPPFVSVRFSYTSDTTKPSPCYGPEDAKSLLVLPIRGRGCLELFRRPGGDPKESRRPSVIEEAQFPISPEASEGGATQLVTLQKMTRPGGGEGV